MRSFAVIAGFAAAANAYAYPAYNTTSEAPAYYAPSSSPAAYQPAYPASSSAPAYGYQPASSSKPVEYGSYTTTTIKGLTTVCATPTTLSVGSKTYTITKSTTIIDNDCEYTTTVPVKPSSTPVKASSSAPAKVSSSAPIKVTSTPSVVKPSTSVVTPPVVSSKPVISYPSGNATVTYPSTPSSTKPSVSQFTGAAAQTGAAMLAIVGAVAAFL